MERTKNTQFLHFQVSLEINLILDGIIFNPNIPLIPTYTHLSPDLHNNNHWFLKFKIACIPWID